MDGSAKPRTSITVRLGESIPRAIKPEKGDKMPELKENDALELAKESAYDLIRNRECEWCAKKLPASDDFATSRRIHITHVECDPAGNTTEYEFCTAPTKDAVIEALSAKLDRVRKVIEGAPSPPWNLVPTEIAEWTLDYEQWKLRALADIGPSEQEKTKC